jgi:hypothetical protein
MITAFLLALAASAGILIHFALTEPPVLPDLTSLQSLAPVTPAPRKSPPSQPSPARQVAPRQPTTTKAPNAEFPTKEIDKLTAALEFRLRSEEFAFDALPYDAPTAEFPLVLVEQYIREPYRTRDMELDSRLSASEADILSRMNADIHGTPRPPPTTPTPPGPSGPPEPPPEESKSGL